MGSPVLDWILAAHSDNKSWEEFQEMDGDYQSLVVAAYRTGRQIDAVLAHEQHRRIKRANRAAKNP